MPTPNTLPLLIERQPDLDQVCAEVSAHRQIALDTEFVRTNTYAPLLGLMQIRAGDLTACVDPLLDLDMGPLWELLFDPQRTNILHSAKQDMEVMWFEQGAIIRNLLDIGTGTGRVLQLLDRHVDQATGLDLSREMLAVARANLADTR